MEYKVKQTFTGIIHVTSSDTKLKRNIWVLYINNWRIFAAKARKEIVRLRQIKNDTIYA